MLRQFYALVLVISGAGNNNNKVATTMFKMSKQFHLYVCFVFFFFFHICFLFLFFNHFYPLCSEAYVCMYVCTPQLMQHFKALRCSKLAKILSTATCWPLQLPLPLPLSRKTRIQLHAAAAAATGCAPTTLYPVKRVTGSLANLVDIWLALNWHTNCKRLKFLDEKFDIDINSRASRCP